MLKTIVRVTSALALAAGPVAAQEVGVGDRAPAISVARLEGGSVRIDAAASKRPTVIEFWATWCEQCEALLPRLRTAATRFAGKVDFYGVNVTVNESKNRVRRYVAREKPPFTVLYDESGGAVRAFGAPVTSYVVIVDASGVVRYTGSGGTQDLAAELAKVVR